MHSSLTLGPTAISRCERPGLALTTALLLGGLACGLFYTGQNINLYVYSGILLFAAFALTICACPHVPLRLGPPGVLLLVFFAWNALSTIWSSVPYTSMIDLGVLASGVMMYMIWRLWNADAVVLPTGFLLIGLGIAFSATMLAQYIMGFPLHAMFKNPNSAAGLLNFLWPFAAILWLDAERGWNARLLALALVFVMITVLALQGSRGALLGAVTALTPVVVVGFVTLRNRRATVLLVVIFAAALTAASALGTGAVSAGTASLADPAAAGSDRFVIWQAAWEMVQQHPWLGYGPGVFWLAYPAFRAPGDASAGFYVHNDYLGFWIETGFPGVLIAVGIGIACLWLFAQTLRRYRHREVPPDGVKAATASFAGIVGVAAHSFFTFNLQMVPFILVLGILLAELERACDGRVWAAPRVPSMRRIPPAIGLVALSLLVVGHFARTAVAFAYTDRGAMLMRQGAYAESAEALSTAHELWTQLDGAWYLHANVLLEAMRHNNDMSKEQRRELVTRAMAMLDRAEQYNPYRATTPLIRGLLRADHPDLTSGSAIAALRKSIALNPRGIEARYALSQLYEREGNYSKAMQVLQQGLIETRKSKADNTPLKERLHALRSRRDSDPQAQPASAAANPLTPG